MGFLLPKLLKAKTSPLGFFQSLQTHFFKGLLAGIYQVRAGDYRLLYGILSRYESVTAEEVLQAARKYLRPENRTVVSLQPVSQAEHDELGEIE
jgi:predicted Zn-dependent peptidase